ncbi:MAG: NYN domain-containing protein, partial [Firmicutes bacterium]|nr:NYN domain-containing protein [Bacillota bacterium]
IEKLIHEMSRSYSVCVVSSDGLIQLCALRLGVRRMSSRELHDETAAARKEIENVIMSHREDLPSLGERTGLGPAEL